MVAITLPNGDIKQFDGQTSVMEVAQSIGAGLAKATVAGRVNGKLVDATRLAKMPPFKSSRQKTRKVWKSFVTPPLTYWVMLSNSCILR